MKLQRTIRMTGGEQRPLALLPDGVFYEPVPSPGSDPNDMCGPCKLLRIAKPESETLDVRVSADDPTLTFGIWEMGKWEAHRIGNGEISASISTTTSEVQILVGTIWRGNAAPFAAPQSLHVRTSVR